MSARGQLAGLLALALSIGPLSAGEKPQTEPKKAARKKPAAEAKKAKGPPADAPAGEKGETAEQRRERLNKLYQRAEVLYRDGLYREAQKLYAQIALEDPNFRSVNSRLRSIRRRLEEAERREREAQIRRLLEAAEAHFAAANYERAAETCKAVLSIEPNNRRAQRRLAECAGELELRRRMSSILLEAPPGSKRRVIARAKSALAQGPEPGQGGPPKDPAPVVRSAKDLEPAPARTKRIVRPGENVEIIETPSKRAAKAISRPRRFAGDPEGGKLLSQAWALYESADAAKDPRPILRRALDTLAPITVVSSHSQHVKDTATMLRKSITRRLAEGGRALTPEEARRARLYQRYIEAEECFRNKRYAEAIRITGAILDEEKHFPLARHLHQEARLKKHEEELQDQEIEHRITIERRLVEIEEAGVPGDEPAPVDRAPIDLRRRTYEVSSPELEEKLNQRVSVNLIDADLDYFLDLLFRSTGVNIIYNPEVVEGMTITVHVANYPLRQLLDYIAKNHGLMFVTTRDGVLITTPDQPALETFVIPLHYGLVDVTEAPPSAAVDQQGGGQPPIDPPSTSNIEQLVDNFPQLLEWPQGSFTYLDRKMNLLYVRTTREVHQKVIELLEPIDKIPHQVLIKTLFIEVDAEEFESFGIELSVLKDIHIGTCRGGRDLELKKGDILKFPQEALPGITTPDIGAALTIAGVLDEPEFELTLDALQRTGRARTLAAPNVICMNNCTARISVTKDLIYIEDYEVDRADISGTTYGYPYFQQQQQQQQQQFQYPLSSEPIIVPVFAEGEDTGFMLDVSPSIGKDSRYISLTLNPRIREEIPPRLTYELVFPVTRLGTDEDAEDITPTTAEVERPIIGERSLSTKLTVADGSIVVLGGLIQQKKVEIRTKIPILSDIPIIGDFFGRRTYRDKKTNLIIFVQAEIITPTGARYADAGRIDETTSPGGTRPVELEEERAPVVRPGPLP